MIVNIYNRYINGVEFRRFSGFFCCSHNKNLLLIFYNFRKILDFTKLFLQFNFQNNIVCDFCRFSSFYRPMDFVTKVLFSSVNNFVVFQKSFDLCVFLVKLSHILRIVLFSRIFRLFPFLLLISPNLNISNKSKPKHYILNCPTL